MGETSGTSAADAAEVDTSAVEVTQWWGDLVLDTAVFFDGEPITIGDKLAPRWRFLGVDMGFVPQWVAPVLRSLPVWSDVALERRAAFAVPEPVVDEDQDWVLMTTPGAPLAVPPGWAREGAESLGEEPIVIVRDAFRFEIRKVGRRRRLDARMGRAQEPAFVAMLGFAAAMFAFVWVCVQLSPAQRHTGANEEEQTLYTALLQVPEQKTTVSGDAGGKARKQPKSKEAAPAPKKSKPDPKRGAHDRDREIAERAGVFSVDSDVTDSLSGASLSDALVAGVGSLIGFQGSDIGGNGLGGRGRGIGCDGDDCTGTYEGLSGIATRGPGRGLEPGTGIGNSKGDGDLTSNSLPPRIIGQLDRAQIDEVVKRHMSQIRYCYQRQIQRNPDLAGKLTVKFTIAARGYVSSAHSDGTLQDAAVRECVEQRFLRMQFPAPKGGGVVVVRYPFLFDH